MTTSSDSWQQHPQSLPVQPSAPAGWYRTSETAEGWWDGARWTGHSRPVSAPSARRTFWPGWVLMTAGAASVIGSFMPWATALGGMLSKSGTQGGDGYFSLILGLIIGGIGVAIGTGSGGHRAATCSLIASLVLGALGIFEVADINHLGSGALSIGSGLVLIITAAVVGVAFSIVSGRRPRQ